MGGAVAPDGQKVAVALRIGFASKFAGMARGRRGDNVNLDVTVAQATKSRGGEPGRPAAASGGIDDSEETVLGNRHGDLERQYSVVTVELREARREIVTLDFERRGARKFLAE